MHVGELGGARGCDDGTIGSTGCDGGGCVVAVDDGGIGAKIVSSTAGV